MINENRSTPRYEPYQARVPLMIENDGSTNGPSTKKRKRRPRNSARKTIVYSSSSESGGDDDDTKYFRRG
jgi:hypothetical protein